MNHLLAFHWMLVCTGLFSCVILNLLLISLNDKFNIGKDKSFGVQKFHTKSTSRLGGVAIGISLYLIYIIINLIDKNHIYSELQSYLILFLISVLPVFVGGILEDITHKIAPNARLLLASISSLLI